MRNDSRRKGGLLRLFLSAVIFCGMMGTLSAQQINLSMKNVTVQEAVAALNQSANYSVILNADEVDMAKRVNVNARNASIREVLDQVFAGQDVTYVIEGNRISVAKRQQPQQSASQQTKGTVKGIVKDANGEPLMGAGVMVKGTRNGTITDLDGNFAVSGVTYPVTLTVSFIGYADMDVTLDAASQSPCVVTMAEDQNYLEEVVVVGYGTQKKVNLTGAVGVVEGKDLQMRPVNSAAQALQGADPSLLLTSAAVRSRVTSTLYPSVDRCRSTQVPHSSSSME